MTHLVDTVTLAATVGLTPRQIQRLAEKGKLTAVEFRTGLNGRPTMWFDLDTAVAYLTREGRGR